MDQIDSSRTVAELVRTIPGAARTFERLRIDYCCRGKQSLRDAASELHVTVAEVIAELAHDQSERTLLEAPQEPAALCAYLVRRHHKFTREELARLLPLAEKVARVHGDRHPELLRVKELVEALAQDLLPHMRKEELVLFPYIERLAAGLAPQAPFGRVDNPIAMMHLEHEQVGSLLAELELTTGSYQPPADGCGSYGALYSGLAALQADIHQHVHLENHVLFPAALALEQSVVR